MNAIEEKMQTCQGSEYIFHDVEDFYRYVRDTQLSLDSTGQAFLISSSKAAVSQHKVNHDNTKVIDSKLTIVAPVMTSPFVIGDVGDKKASVTTSHEVPYILIITTEDDRVICLIHVYQLPSGQRKRVAKREDGLAGLITYSDYGMDVYYLDQAEASRD